MDGLRGLVAKVLPPPGLPRTLAAQSAVYGLGNGTYVAGSVVFFSLYTGLSPTAIGIGFSFAGLLSLVGSLPFGHLADRIGGRHTWALGSLLAAAAFVTYPLVHTFWAFLVTLGVVTVGETLANAGRNVYTAAAVPPEIRVRTMAFVRAYLNVGFTAGAGLAAGALAIGTRWALVGLVLVAAAGMTVNTLVVMRMPQALVDRAPGRRPSPWGVLRDHPYTAWAAVIGMLWLNQNVLNELIPLWAVTRTDAPRPVLGGLIALNTVMAVLLQVRATRGADSLPGSVRLTRWAALATAIACPVIAVTGRTHGWVTVAVLAAAVMLTTATELWMSAAQWFFATEVPPAAQRGAYQGATKSVGGLFTMVGPAAMTYLAITTGGWGWWVVGAFFGVCAVVIGPIVAWIERTPRNGDLVAATA
ncbi:MFS transporter [Actinoplanes sp. TBRC 11911]|uniref:MFS transporter n=1 Tax=Actinoplanes sp. TBRC 11911 TaxID=2729386 RepID=UPI00145C6BAA|nr:MFS transporter [Actinoplanes sp. TBRC 11911]NMO49964.1 MFS transporter [Actinoplanes sp. TBRC 11911]